MSLMSSTLIILWISSGDSVKYRVYYVYICVDTRSITISHKISNLNRVYTARQMT